MPLPRLTPLWNQRRCDDPKFLGANVTSFKPFGDPGIVPEKVLNQFCEDRGLMFLALISLVNLFDCVSLEEEAQRSYDRLNVCLNLSVANKMGSSSKSSPKDCPLVWDTGAV